jgi:3-oxoacyl-[acyl-carrier protein] reductase
MMSPIPYAVAKAGIQLLTQALAIQAGPYGVRVNCLAPETILTERNFDQIPASVQATIAEEHPLRRLGTPEDVAQAALYLASDDSSWLAPPSDWRTAQPNWPRPRGSKPAKMFSRLANVMRR